MTEKINWQQAIHGERDAEAAQILIESINELLQDDVSEVLRLIASELTLSLRNIRYKVQKIDYECDPHSKETVLFKGSDTSGVTLASYSQELMDLITDGRQVTDLLTFYAMALSESKNEI